MKRTPLKRGTKSLKRTAFKVKRTPVKSQNRSGASKPKKRDKLPSVKTVRNRCDKLLTPIIKKKYPYCLLCGSETQVAHHHIKKSTSSSCRYYMPNLIPLCHHCHLRLHSDELYWCGRVIKIMGMEWLDDLESQKKIYTKTDVHYYLSEEKRLTDILYGQAA